MFSSLFRRQKPSSLQLQIDLLNGEQQQFTTASPIDANVADVDNTNTSALVTSSHKIPIVLSSQTISGHIKIHSNHRNRTVGHSGVQIELIGQIEFYSTTSAPPTVATNTTTTTTVTQNDTLCHTKLNQQPELQLPLSPRPIQQQDQKSKTTTTTTNNNNNHKATKIYQFLHQVQTVSGPSTIPPSSDTALFFHFPDIESLQKEKMSSTGSTPLTESHESYHGKLIQCHYFLIVKLFEQEKQEKLQKNSSKFMDKKEQTDTTTATATTTIILSPHKKHAAKVLIQLSQPIIVQCINDPLSLSPTATASSTATTPVIANNNNGNNSLLITSPNSPNSNLLSLSSSSSSSASLSMPLSSSLYHKSFLDRQISLEVGLGNDLRFIFKLYKLLYFLDSGRNSSSHHHMSSSSSGGGGGGDVLLGKIVFLKKEIRLKRIEIGIMRRERIFHNHTIPATNTNTNTNTHTNTNIHSHHHHHSGINDNDGDDGSTVCGGDDDDDDVNGATNCVGDDDCDDGGDHDDDNGSYYHADNQSVCCDDPLFGQSVMTVSYVETHTETLSKFEVLDGDPMVDQMIPIRLYLSGITHLTPTYVVDSVFDVTYHVNICLIDVQDRRLFKQQEIGLYRRNNCRIR